MKERSYLLLPFRFPFRFASDMQQAPRLDGKVLTAGMDWMRINFPSQWAAFCAARMHRHTDDSGRTWVQVTKLWWSGFDKKFFEDHRVQSPS